MNGGGIFNGLGVLLTGVGALGGLGSLVLVFMQRHKAKADATQVVTSTAITLIKPLQERLEAVEAETRRLRRLYTRLVRAIMSPTASIDKLRELVAKEPI